MEKKVLKNHHHPHNKTNSNIAPSTSRHVTGERFIKPAPAQSADFVLRWGSRKRLRCMKIQVKNDCTTVRVDRRIVGFDNNSTVGSPRNGHFNPRQQRPAQHPLRVLRNTEGGSGMKGHNSNNNNTNQNQNQNQSSNGGGGMRGLASPEREKKHHHHNHHHENMLNGNGGGRTASSGGGGGSSSGGGSDVVWPPKFVIALTNKEKEEDFMAIKGSKLPQRPKKRAKFIQRTLNLVSPGGWLCDLTLERYEVREKKIAKKRPRGLKALGNYMESDSD